MEFSTTDLFDTLTIQNDQMSYVKHVLAPLYVFFTLFGCRGGDAPQGARHGGDVSSVLVRDSPPPSPPPPPSLPSGPTQLPRVNSYWPYIWWRRRRLNFFFSFPLPILSTLHPNTILEPNLDSNAHPNPQPNPNPTHKPYQD